MGLVFQADTNQVIDARLQEILNAQQKERRMKAGLVVLQQQLFCERLEKVETKNARRLFRGRWLKFREVCSSNL
jgi:ribose 5-phosphate isomerase